MNFTADPENGRFISQDSYRGQLNAPNQWHLYAYCANNPINYTDPTGHFSYSHSAKKKLITVKVSFNDLEVAGIIVSMKNYADIIKASKTCYKEYVKGKIPVICQNVGVIPRYAKILNFTYLALLVGIQIAQKSGNTFSTIQEN